MSKYFWMERNRFAVLLMYYKWPTLFLILPMMLALEIGLWFFAIKSGWGVNGWFISTGSNHQAGNCGWPNGAVIQKNRKIPDRDLLKTMAATVNFSEKAVESPVLKYMGNPVMRIYYLFLRAVVRW